MIENPQELKAQISEKFAEKIVTSFLDTIILVNFRDCSFSGYDALQFINREFGLHISSGTIYSTIYSMERKELLAGSSNGKRVFRLTDLGKITLEVAAGSSELMALIESIKGKK
jgi:DNA-binding PadR family transcriptional regulator